MTASNQPVSDAALEQLRHVSTATLTTQLFKRGLRNVFLQGVAPLVPPAPGTPNLVGPAFTLRNIPAREDLDHVGVFQDPDHPQRKAVETAPAGSVLVQDCRGDRTVASVGSILALRLAKRGVAGMVSDGPVRDSATIAAFGLPIWCTGASAPLNLAKHHAVDLNVPIACGGVPVYPGDIVVADADGVVIVPREMAVQVAQDAAEQELLEAFITERIEAGSALRGTYPPDEATLAAYRAWREQRAG
ncbi:regulator of RNase E activity RraA [Paraburkholderia eburnea]|uniref:Regulator of RNase E activity RraA n=1 Tax=Paraburkholderia eburnea TaxID=1189126 RepID=A0A2S4MJY0_9BURK|nr:ribonuclease activity regulator RraA [Paraburkholderia eburnea]POR54971.1 regulator of RNase E activity RraA [Paraburkholderia eburnea]PRZ24430.1 regulator of RNase E activity RraA [Paraburkholderia eburnea]